MTMPSQRSIIYPCWLRIAIGKDPVQVVYLMQHIGKFEGIAEVTWTNMGVRGLPVAVVEARFKNRTLCEAFADSLPPSMNIQEPAIYSSTTYVRAQIVAAYEDAMAGMQRLNTILDRYDSPDREISQTNWVRDHFNELASWRAHMDRIIEGIVRKHGGV